MPRNTRLKPQAFMRRISSGSAARSIEASVVKEKG